MKVKVGIVGCGAILPYYLKAIGKIHDYQLTSLCDLKYQECVKDGINYFSNIEQMLTISANHLDLVILATPPDSHYDLALSCLKHHVNVVVEKPLALNLAQAKALISYAKRQNSLCYAAYHTAFNPKFNHLATNDVENIEIIYKEDVRNYHPDLGWIFDAKIAGGGCIVDSGINIFSALIKKFGPIKILKVVLRYSPGFNVETGADINFSLYNQKKGTISMDWLSETEERVYRFTDNSSFFQIDLADPNFGPTGRESTEAEYLGLMGDVGRSLKTKAQVSDLNLKPLETTLQTYQIARTVIY